MFRPIHFLRLACGAWRRDQAGESVAHAALLVQRALGLPRETAYRHVFFYIGLTAYERAGARCGRAIDSSLPYFAWWGLWYALWQYLRLRRVCARIWAVEARDCAARLRHWLQGSFPSRQLLLRHCTELTELLYLCCCEARKRGGVAGASACMQVLAEHGLYDRAHWRMMMERNRATGDMVVEEFAVPEAGPRQRAAQVLGVAVDADRSTLRRQYRRLARLLHPDKCRNEAERAMAHLRFIELREAFELLYREAA